MSANDVPERGVPLSITEFQRLPEEDLYRVELVRGRLVREPRPAPPHARVLMRVAALLDAHARATGRGDVLPDAGFILSADPPTVRGPDVAFVSRERLPERAYEEPGFWHLAPDLAVEVVSPSNTAAEIHEKVREYLDAGTSLVWVVDPRTRTVAVHRSPGETTVLREGDDVDGGDVLPAFSAAVSELFAR